MANPYSKYTGQRVSAIPAGYLEANARAAANMQKGLAGIGEAIGKYYGNKREKEEEDKQKQAVFGAYEIGSKLTETYTDSDLMIGELAGTDEFGNRINSFGETIEVANPMPEAVGTDLRKIGGVEEPKQFFGGKDAMSVGRLKGETPQDLPALPGVEAPAPDPLDVVPSGGGLEPIAPYSPEAAPESTIKEGFEPARIDPQLEYLAKPQIDRVEFVIETEKQRNRTVNENMTEWLSTYGKDADATTAAQAYDIIKGYADDRNAREANKLQRKANKLLLESRKADIKKTEVETKKIEQEVEILGQPAQEWGKGSAIKVKLDDGTELPYAFVPTSKSGGVTVPFSNVPPADELSTDPSIAARYMEILKNELDSYNAIMAGPENVSTGMMRSEEEPGWWKNMPDSWKQSVDAKAQLIMATQKRLHEAGLLTELPSPLPSLLNPGKSLTPAPVAPEQRETQLKDREEKLNKLFPGSRPTQ